MKPLDINPEKLMAQTSMYHTMVLSEDGKTITMNNKVHAFKIRALPATVAFRLLKKYPIEVISWAYLGMPLKKSDVFSFGALCLNKEGAIEDIKDAEWESLDTIDKCWDIFMENDCILVADVKFKNDSSRYQSMNKLISSDAYDDRSHNLLELMTLSTYIIRLSIDCFFLEYTSFLERGKTMSSLQNNVFGSAIQDTFLDIIQAITDHLRETGSTFMSNQRKKAMKSKKS